MHSFYDIVNVSEESSSEELKKAYFDFLRRTHPDKVGEDLADIEQLNAAAVIWNRVKTKEGREEYNYWLREQKLRESRGTIAERIEIYEDETEVEEYCRCGDEYQVPPEDIKKIIDRGIFECGSCSLCLEVLKNEHQSDCSRRNGNRKKTSLCNALAGTPGTNFPETVGAAVVMTWHEYRAGTPEQKSELIELWDIDGQRSHHQAAQVFFEGAHGAILVYDVSNKRSEENMGFWMTMLDGKQRKPASGATPLLDLESCPIPVLIVGCKVDIRPQRSLNTYERVFVNTRNKIQSGSPNYINFARGQCLGSPEWSL
ncbi:unnamed protein product [Caenorhabditis auriculariae]|uniref:J domain-containing protein n=1 Tax=Caenorhabditis auriculariae TaxID=2777116 RepID=A0A8S1HCD6_9PELO|nr:unnamed protein product [Caenorhabditis auriculariae]